jgi:glycosyltransferase involved in cell wall biosynthesis
MSISPRISILMPAFNAEKHIAQAIESILQQTFTDFELRILNDGSTDRTSECIRQFQDPRITVVDAEQNQGLVLARNQLVAAARGHYIAFLDADDIAAPNRLEWQIAYLESGKADICGGAHDALYEASGKIKRSKERYSDADIRALMTVCSPLCNPAVMGRAEAFKNHPYPVGKDYAEDYSLWTELALAGYRFANLKQKLITYRIHSRQTSQVQNAATNVIFNQSRKSYITRLGLSEEGIPRTMVFIERLRLALPFMFELNQRISGISVGANAEIYARFQYRGNGLLTPLTRLERWVVALLATIKGRT